MMTKQNSKRRVIKTVWEVRTYDVWGNAKDGYEVNDLFIVHRAYELEIPVETANPGTKQAFNYAYPTDKQIRQALDIKPKFRLDIDGDDMHLYVNLARDGYPLGEMYCTSHDSLSPIQAKS